MKIRNMLFSLGVLGLAAQPVLAKQHMKMPVQVGSAPVKILTDAKGMTLYTFDKDKPGVSNCNGGCATKWPPLMAAKMAKPMGSFTVIKRADGSAQWAHKGQPLYLWFKDKKKGDVTGDGVKGIWHVARP